MDWAESVLSRVKDADTIVDNDDKTHRIKGVNAPETGTPAGEAATSWAKEVLSKNPVEVVESGKQGHYGRELSDIKFKDTGNDYAETLVRKGHAIASGRGPENAHLQQAETQATVNEVLGLQERQPSNNYQIDYSDQEATDLRQPGGTFRRAFNRGIDTTQAMGSSAVNALGNLIGSDTLEAWGEEGLKQNLIEAALNPAEIQSYEDIEDFNDAFTYAVEALGEQGANLLTTLGIGGAGAGAIKATIGKKFLQNATRDAVKLKKAYKQQLKESTKKGINDPDLVNPGSVNAMAAKTAAENKAKSKLYNNAMLPGVAASSYGMGVGEINSELLEAGVEDRAATAFTAAVPFAALDTFGFQQTIGRLFKGIDKDIATQTVKDIGGAIFKSIGIGSAAEATTEMLQEVITLSARAYHDPTFEIFSEENLQRIKEAGVKAAIVGGTLGGSVTGVNKAVGKLTAPKVPESDPYEGLTNFPKRDNDYSYFQEAGINVDGAEISQDLAGSEVELTAALETVDENLNSLEKEINVYEAFRRCLS
jgi:hypothetical protein